MEAKLNGGVLKIWFSGISTSRNIPKTISLKVNNDIGIIETIDGDTFFINMRNVNLIEEVE